ncbi:hypothetical protein PF008_g10504 [Phytophthora fragariae]|uniref:Uncharacterized protein n=1 Tax=Phytophthora fragariae TaxID=53985 RepID=A0A6G0RTG0_9STRA|nr:hypothetical protein PF008_g10504 [Phytophthora fragariae]
MGTAPALAVCCLARVARWIHSKGQGPAHGQTACCLWAARVSWWQPQLAPRATELWCFSTNKLRVLPSWLALVDRAALLT